MLECGKAAQIRQIWDEVAVGQSGSINSQQLSTICEHIGMEGLTSDDVDMLFQELDADSDGLVTLEEFLTGLFGTRTPRNINVDDDDADTENCFQHDDDDDDVVDDFSSSTLTLDSCKKRKLLSSVILHSPGRKKVSCFIH